MQASALEEFAAHLHVLACVRQHLRVDAFIRGFGRDRHIERAVFGEDDEGRASADTFSQAILRHRRSCRTRFGVLNKAGDIANVASNDAGGADGFIRGSLGVRGVTRVMVRIRALRVLRKCPGHEQQRAECDNNCFHMKLDLLILCRFGVSRSLDGQLLQTRMRLPVGV
jgi:hypothetical protein